jgi:hypothetical protein
MNKNELVKKSAINKELLANADKLKTELSVLEDKITDRIDYIVKYCFGKIDTWYFEGAQEGSNGDLWENIKYKEVEGIIISSGERFPERTKRDLIIINADGGEINLYDSFPKRWLFEDFEKEVDEGKIKYEKKQLEKKNKRNEKKDKTKSLAKSAAEKLSKDELAAILKYEGKLSRATGSYK